MIKTILNKCHVSLTDVSELSRVSRVSLDKYILLYESEHKKFINNKGIVVFFDYLETEKNISKASTLYCLIRLFSGLGTYEDRLINSRLEKMNKEEKRQMIEGINQNINGGAHCVEDESDNQEKTISKEKAIRIWESYYGDYSLVCDFAGRIMNKDDYGKSQAVIDLSEEDSKSLSQEGEGSYYCGWNLHHMMPKEKGGSNSETNLIPTNIKTNETASNKTSYVIDDHQYEVRRTRGKKVPYYGIYDKESGEFLIGFTPLK